MGRRRWGEERGKEEHSGSQQVSKPCLKQSLTIFTACSFQPKEAYIGSSPLSGPGPPVLIQEHKNLCLNLINSPR